MTFNYAFDTTLKNLTNKYVIGENGALSQSTLQQIDPFTLDDNNRINYYNKLIEVFLLVRNDTRLIDKLSNLLTNMDNVENRVDLIKTLLFIRNPRKGKGEKKIFYDSVLYLWNTNRKISELLLELTPQFGYWNDFNYFYKNGDNDIKKYVINIFGNKLVEDFKLLKENKKISLCGKWAPRENSKNHNFTKELSEYVCNKLGYNTNNYGNYKMYRKIVVELNKEIKTIETYMCQKKWKEIDFKNVSSISMNTYTKAFQNLKTNPFPKNKRRNSLKYNGVRHTIDDKDYEDRNECKENLYKYLELNKKVNSSVCDLSKIIEKYLNGYEMDIIWEKQWENRINEIKELIKTLPEHPKIFPMVDLSSSMSGNPMIYAITLGLFTSIMLDIDEQENEFCNRFLTFNTFPQLVKLPRNGTLHDKIKIMKYWCGHGKWGGSTNIQLAVRTLLDIGKKYNINQDKMPKTLAIFSDMEFDVGDESWENGTSYEMIKKDFENYGYEVPHIIFWNLRENTQGYQVLTDVPNSTMLSGYSTRMLDLFLTSQLDEMTEENVEKHKKNTTFEMFLKMLENDMFNEYNDIIKNRML
jgi:hypothetical protein